MCSKLFKHSNNSPIQLLSQFSQTCQIYIHQKLSKTLSYLKYLVLNPIAKPNIARQTEAIMLWKYEDPSPL